MSSSKITLRGMYIYYDNMGGDLFEKLTFPEGISKNVVVDTILLNGGDYECLYGDPTFVHDSIENWSAKWLHTFERWINVLSTDYEPLWNYDRNERETRTPDITHTRTPNLTDERTPDLTDKRTPDLTDKRTPDLTDERTPDLTNERTPDLTDTNGGTITEEHTRSAFDSSGYQPSDKDTTTPQNTLHTTGTDTYTETGTDTTTHTGTDTTTHTGTETVTRTGKETEKHTGSETKKETGSENWMRRMYGNIGVTTSQQMLKEELEISAWSLYDSIARLFLSEYVIPIMV